MTMDHISNKVMRLYLLGQLPDDQAAALEEEYFSNRSLLLKIQSEEAALIADYLDGALPYEVKQCFEDRYLQVPLLRQEVEEMRERRRNLSPAAQLPFWTHWRVACALSACLVAGLAIWIYHLNAGPPQEPAHTLQSHLHSTISVRINPGLSKGPGSEQVQFTAPESGSTVKLVLELPGQLLPTQFRARISLVDTNGRWVSVWNSSAPLTSSADGNGQAVTLQIIGSLLRPNDYIVEVWSLDGEIHETYSYRVNSISSVGFNRANWMEGMPPDCEGMLIRATGLRSIGCSLQNVRLEYTLCWEPQNLKKARSVPIIPASTLSQFP